MSYPIFALIGIILLVSTGGVAYYQGREDGKALQIASQKSTEDLIEAAADKFNKSVSDKIAKIRINHTTVQGKLIRETSTNTVYRECEHTDAGLQYLNDALTNRSRPVSGGDSKLPKTVDTVR